MPLPLRLRPNIQLWSVETDSVQLTWSDLPTGKVTAWCAEAHHSIDHPGGPGSLVLSGLLPAQAQRIDVTWAGGNAHFCTHTLTPPPGELLFRFATLNDVHIGARRWGASKLMVDRSGLPDPHPIRCARAAINEATAWGAELIAIKGDAVHHQVEHHFAALGRLLDQYPDTPMLLVPGNHDVDGATATPLPATIGERRLPYITGAERYDADGIGLIMVNTTVPKKGPGALHQANKVYDLLASGDGPVFIGLHHQLQRHRIPTHYPLGINGREAQPFLAEVKRRNPNVLISSGHTHRNRRRHYGSVVTTEIASSRDWPGVWAGYAVYEGGIVQIIRRVAAPDALTWHEYSSGALGGLWGPWATGTVEQRCFTHLWR